MIFSEIFNFFIFFIFFLLEIRQNITELIEKNKRHSDLLFDHGQKIPCIERKLSDVQVKHVEKQANNDVKNTSRTEMADVTTFCDLRSDMEEVLRLKINEIVGVVSDMSWRLGRVETKFFMERQINRNSNI